MTEPLGPPLIRFVAGNPTDEEIAAVVTLLTAQSAARPADPGQPHSGWAAYWRSVGAPIQPGPGKWQAAVRGW
jgi:hypothetical protein